MAANKGVLDIISIGTSLLCLIHCLLLPVFLTSLPFLGIEILENKWLELLTITVTIIIGGLAIYRGYKKFHRNKIVVFLFLTGGALLLLANMTLNRYFEFGVKLSGAFFVVLAHIKNLKTCSTCGLNKCGENNSL